MQISISFFFLSFLQFYLFNSRLGTIVISCDCGPRFNSIGQLYSLMNGVLILHTNQYKGTGAGFEPNKKSIKKKESNDQVQTLKNSCSPISIVDNDHSSVLFN